MPTILFPSPEAVMLRIPKTGSTSIVKGLFGGIETAEKIVWGPPLPEWRDHYQFGFVRNPFDRLVSALIMFKSYRTETEAEARVQSGLSLNSMMDFVLDKSVALDEDNYLSKLRMHALPMTDPFFGLDQANDVYRFEDYAAEYKRLCDKLGCKVPEIPHARKSNRDAYQEYYNEQEKRRAAEIFANDCQTFGYSFA